MSHVALQADWLIPEMANFLFFRSRNSGKVNVNPLSILKHIKLS